MGCARSSSDSNKSSSTVPTCADSRSASGSPAPSLEEETLPKPKHSPLTEKNYEIKFQLSLDIPHSRGARWLYAQAAQPERLGSLLQFPLQPHSQTHARKNSRLNCVAGGEAGFERIDGTTG